MRPPDPFADRYTKLRLVGRGGFGVVYRAWDTEMERDIALKLLNPELAVDVDWRKRFRLEATAASKLQHPNITIVFDRGEYESQPFIVMEFVEGEPLSKVIEQRISLSDPERLFLIEQLCDGLHYAHQRSIVHRDVKPVNLVVREDHDGTHLVRTLKILDFGIAKVVNTGQTSTGGMMFTPSYVSPEQIRGEEVDRRSDMFAVGAVAYELLVLKKAFDIISKNPFTFLEEVKQKICEEPHQPMTAIRPDVDPELSAVIDRALAKAPEDRFKDLAEMRRSLHRIRTRLEESEPSTSQTTIVLNSKLQAVVKQARQALEADDPSAAVAHLQKALGSASNKVVQRFIEQSLEEAQERQAAKRLERRARDEGAARAAIENAKVEFERGDTTLAIRRLDGFQPAELVAEARGEIARAAALVRRAERIIAEGTPDDRDAVLRELEEFTPDDLVKAALARLRARDGLERAAAARAQAAIQSARDSFSAGNRVDSVRSLEQFDEPRRIDSALNELREANTAIEEAASVVRSGSRRERSEALDGLDAFPYPDLVAHALGELRSTDREMRATEDLDQAAQALIKSAREQFDRGDRNGPIARLQGFVPAHPSVTAALAELRARTRQLEEEERAAVEAAAQSAIARARKRFAEGAPQEAIDGLRKFAKPGLVADAVRTLEQLTVVVARTEERVRTGNAEERRGALDTLARAGGGELTDAALATLRALDAKRTADEQRLSEEQQKALEAERVAAARAQAAIVAARDAFSAGNRADAIRRLEQFDEPGRVNAALNELRAANAALELASRAVRTAPRREREAALGRLEASTHRDLIARELAELRAAADEMRAAEVRDEAAAALIESAREQFDRGDRTGPLARLEAFTPAHPGVTAALEELRDRVRQLEEEEKAAVEAAAQNAIAKARKRFAEGARKDAIDALRKFIKPSLVAAAVAELDKLATAVARTEERVRTGTPDERRGAIEKLARAGSNELTETAIATLRALDAKRTADEQREKQEKQKALEEQRARLELEKQAHALEAKARAIFVKGSADEALRLLTGFGASGLVAETLRTLQAAAGDIEAARAAVAREPAPLRRTAIERLERRAPQDLFAHAVVELKKVDEERRAAEEQAEAERIAAAAERVAVDARQLFARGEHEAALKALLAFTPVLPPVARAIEDLRREYALILAARAEEEKERKRLEAERAAKVREVAKLVAEADKAAADKRFDEAAAVLDRASALVPDSGDLAKARTRLARAIDSEETRARRVRVRAVLEQVPAAVDTGEFATAAERLSEAEKLGASPSETTPLREHLRTAQDELKQMSAALATAKAAILAAAAEPNADARVKALDRTLGAALTVPPGTHAAARLWPEYHDALQRIRDLRQEVAVAEARDRIERALAERSTRKAERALRDAEAAFPGVAWKDLQLKLAALQSARATEPSILGRALPQVRRVPVLLVAALAALVIAVIVLAVWRPWVRTAPPPPPPKVEGAPDPGPKRPTLVEQAASSLAAGRRREALMLALESLKANDRDQPTLQLLTRLRTESASATSAARDKAVSAGGTSHPDFKAAEQKTADAQALTDPGRTEAAVRAFDEATELYQRIETTSFSAAKFLAAAQQERTAGRAEGALSYALQGIGQFPEDDGLIGFLRSLRREAADRVASARAAAVKAGATDASATFRSARDRERFATARGGPEQTGDALVALREADGLYRQAAKEADQLRADQLQQQQATAEKLKQDIAAGLKAADSELKGGRLEAATQAVNGVLARDPNNPTARQLQQAIREAVKERDRVANEAGERKRRQGEAATLVDQAKRAASPQQAIDLLVQAEQLDSSNTEIAPLLAQKRLELKNRSDPGPITTPPGPKPPLPEPGPGTNPGDEQLILRTIQQYAAAMTARNPGDVVELFPSARRRDLENTFKMFSEYSFQLQPVSGVQINGNSATVRCTLRLQTNSGQQGRMTQPDRVTVVRLTKAGNRWVIQSLGG